MCAEAGAAFALSSDAHAPDQVGYAYDQALTLLESLDVNEISVFERRRRRLEPLSQVQKRENPGP
jgi:histidinol-phosphatase (PHP family)